MKILNNYIYRELAGESVLIPTGSITEEFNGIVTLSDSGVFIYNNIEKATKFDDLIDMIISEYEVEKEVAIQDAVLFINQMLYMKVIALSDVDKNW